MHGAFLSSNDVASFKTHFSKSISSFCSRWQKGPRMLICQGWRLVFGQSMLEILFLFTEFLMGTELE